jgi:hypothetical protein
VLLVISVANEIIVVLKWGNCCSFEWLLVSIATACCVQAFQLLAGGQDYA